GCDTQAHNTAVSLPGRSTGNKQLDAFLQALALKTGDLSVTTDATHSSSSSTTQSLSIGAPAMPPVLAIGSLAVASSAQAPGKTVQNLVQATAKNISLANGAVTIGSVISTSNASSDGTTGYAQGTLAFADVTVLLGGTRYAASIDNRGIHVSQPGLSRNQ